MWRTIFVRSELAIAIFIELLQGLGRLGDLVGVNDAIPIEVEGGNDRRDGRTISLRSGTGAGAFSGWRTARSAGVRRKILVGGELAVAIFIQFLQREGGLGDFVGVDDTIVVRVQDGDNRQWRVVVARPARSAWGSSVRGRAVGRLCRGEPRR